MRYEQQIFTDISSRKYIFEKSKKKRTKMWLKTSKYIEIYLENKYIAKLFYYKLNQLSIRNF